MSDKIIFLGGVGEIGANSIYFYFDGTGIIVDAGLHPIKRNREAFPNFVTIQNQPTDLLIITHAHTDHIGSLPYLLKYHPHIKIYSTKATAELLDIMLRDTTKILKSEIVNEFPEYMLSLYNPEILEKINTITEGFNYFESLEFTGVTGRKKLLIKLFPSGHILGSASVYFEDQKKNLLITSDVNFSNQNIIASAKLPSHHIHTLIIEATNAADNDIKDYATEKKRLAEFINSIVNDNGSVLIPAFALGKSQELLKILFDLMKKGSIPRLKVYTAGMQKKISRIYDKYCYAVEMLNPGFEISDIEQERIFYKDLYSGDYFREPSIVLITSGMMNHGTLSFKLAKHWFRLKNYGIAIVGYQDPQSPGYSLLKSEIDREFEFAGEKLIRKCRVEKFRFTSHALLDDLVNYIIRLKPVNLFIVHGETNACNNLTSIIGKELKTTKIHIPDISKEYFI